MFEKVDLGNLPLGFSVISETENKNYPYFYTYTTYEKSGKDVVCKTNFKIRLFSSEIPKFLQKQIEKISVNKAKYIRNIEEKTARNEF